jgi:cbb3-type cytochrome oxidase cytochrome c subunit
VSEKADRFIEALRTHAVGIQGLGYPYTAALLRSAADDLVRLAEKNRARKQIEARKIRELEAEVARLRKLANETAPPVRVVAHSEIAWARFLPCPTRSSSLTGSFRSLFPE